MVLGALKRYEKGSLSRSTSALASEHHACDISSLVVCLKLAPWNVTAQ